VSDLTVTKTFRVRRERHGRKRLKVVSESPSEKIPRIARLMALAIQFDEMIRSGVVANQSEVARLGHVTRARVTQILDLTILAPSVQEALLYCPPSGVTERQIRPVVAVADWMEQIQLWEDIQGKATARGGSFRGADRSQRE
jgi:hypothetical protein